MNSMLDLKHILVAHDLTETSDAALDYGLALALKLGGEVAIVHAYEVPSLGAPEVLMLATDWLEQVKDGARERLDQVVESARLRGFHVESILREGRPWRVVVEVAEETRVDLIIVGTEGRHGVPRLLLGSVAEHIVRMARCPVLVARRPEPDASARAKDVFTAGRAPVAAPARPAAVRS